MASWWVSGPAWSGSFACWGRRTRGAGRGSCDDPASGPDLAGQRGNELQLPPLLILSQRVADLSRDEAALGAESQLLEGQDARRLVDPAQELITRFHLCGLRGDQAQHDHLVRRHEAKQLEGAGTRGVVLQEEAIAAKSGEQPLSDGVVGAFRRPAPHP